MATKSKNWCFTSYVMDFEPENHKDILSYASWQHEKGDEKDHLHIQGYVECHKVIDATVVKECLPKGCHIEKRRGTQKQAIDYTCKKDTQVEPGWEWGTMSKSGDRNDLKAVKEMVENGKTMTEIATENTEQFIKYHNGIEKYFNMKQKKRCTMPDVFIIWGAAGKRKSKQVYDEYDDVFTKGDHKWWNGYEQNKCILLDDYDDSWGIKRNELLKLLDRYPYQGETKGGFVHINSPVICITSNFDPTTWKIWSKALERRITKIYEK